MSKPMKTPGVYIQELDAFGNSVVPVPTAIPVFIGYTKETVFKGESLINEAIRVTSLADFQTFFGKKPPQVEFNLSKTTAPAEPDLTYEGQGYSLSPATTNFRMNSAIQFFYANGGATCYVMSIGDYNSTPDKNHVTKAIDLLKKETEPTMLVIPDLVEFATTNAGDPLATKYADAYSIQSKMINHCGEDMPSRVAILDVPGGFNEPEDDPTASVEAFRSNVNPIIPKSNSYAAAYYPWLHTTIYQDSDVSSKNLTSASLTILKGVLTSEFANEKDPKKKAALNDMTSYLTNPAFLPTGVTSLTPDERVVEVGKADAAMKKQSKFYELVLNAILEQLNLMPPSAAMAGIYTSVDNNIGVWKAPANVGVQNVIAPAVKIDHDMQEDLNKPINGKSVCAIRAFKGMGNLVWGARTLDGNSNDWRYINVRRTLIYIEQSIKDAAKAYVFDPNDANTWVTVQSMISNFLTGLWKQGGLVGPKPADAFSVSVGLGTTMSNDDIQNGIMRISVKVALSHPAEFIEITFQQQQQKA